MNNIINPNETEHKYEAKEKEEKKEIIAQIFNYQRIIEEAKKKGFRTRIDLPNSQEILNCQLDTLKLHLDNFHRVAQSAKSFKEGVNSSQTQSSTQLTESQKRLLENSMRRWKATTLSGSWLEDAEKEFPGITKDREIVEKILEEKEENLPPELQNLRRMILSIDKQLNERLKKWREKAKTQGIKYDDILPETMKPWAKYAQVGYIMKLIKQKEEKMREGNIGKTVATINSEKTAKEEVQKWPAQHPETAAAETVDDKFEQFDEFDKLGKIIGEGFKEAVKPLSEAINKQGQKIDGLTEKIGEINKVVFSAAQTEGTPMATQSQHIPPLTAKILAEALRQGGIDAPPTGSGSLDDDRNRRDNNHEHMWGKKVIWLLSLITGLLAFGGVLYLFSAFNGVKDTTESAKQLATTASATASEAKSLAQTARTIADQAQSTANKAIEYDKIQDSRLDEHEKQINIINSKILGIVAEIKELSGTVEFNKNEIVKLNDSLAEIRKELRQYASQFQLTINDLEEKFGNQIADLDRELRKLDLRVYNFVTSNQGGFCVWLIGCFFEGRSIKQEKSLVLPPTSPDQPTLLDCTSGIDHKSGLMRFYGVGRDYYRGVINFRADNPCINYVQAEYFRSIAAQPTDPPNQIMWCSLSGNLISCPLADITQVPHLNLIFHLIDGRKIYGLVDETFSGFNSRDNIVPDCGYTNQGQRSCALLVNR